MKPSKTLVADLATKAARCGVATTCLRLTQEETLRIRRAEAQGGQQAGLAVIVQLLRKRRTEKFEQ